MPYDAVTELDVRNLVEAEVRRVVSPWKWFIGVATTLALLLVGGAVVTFEGERGPEGQEGPQGVQGVAGTPGGKGDRGAGADIGMVVAWPAEGEESIPDGWKLCDGSALLAAEYPVLADLLSPTYGVEGLTHFLLPDYRGYFLRGSGQSDSGPGSLADITTGSTPGKVGSVQHAMVKLEEDVSLSPILQVGGRLQPDDEQDNDNQVLTQPGNGEGGRPYRIENDQPETRPINVAVQWIIRVE